MLPKLIHISRIRFVITRLGRRLRKYMYKQYNVPGLEDTRKLLARVYTKSAKRVGRAQLEAIKDRLDGSKTKF